MAAHTPDTKKHQCTQEKQKAEPFRYHHGANTMTPEPGKTSADAEESTVDTMPILTTLMDGRRCGKYIDDATTINNTLPGPSNVSV